MIKRYAVVIEETGTPYRYYNSKEEAEKVAKAMTGYHQRKYVAKELDAQFRAALAAYSSKPCVEELRSEGDAVSSR